MHIFLAFESPYKIGDVKSYRAKATALCKSCKYNLKKSKEALLSDIGGNATTGEVGSAKSYLDK
jgi:hypothetical protein